MINVAESNSKKWYLYLVRSLNNKLYCGISHDPVARFYKHCTGRGAKFFSSSRADALVYIEPCESKSQALKREQAVKKLSKIRKEQLIKDAPPTYLLPLVYSDDRQVTFMDVISPLMN